MTLIRAIQRLTSSIQDPEPPRTSAQRREPERSATKATAPAAPVPGEPVGPADPLGPAEQAGFLTGQIAPNLKPVNLHGHEPLIGLWGHAGVPVPAGPAPVGERVRRSVPQDVKIAVSARDGGRCRRCGSTHQLHFDHVIPVSRGGANTVANIQLLCGSCNRAKSSKLKLAPAFEARRVAGHVASGTPGA